MPVWTVVPAVTSRRRSPLGPLVPQVVSPFVRRQFIATVRHRDPVAIVPSQAIKR
jgi:hypothetical protein